jgi:glycosyltransferase involved in cell wall biosynthesis
MVLTRAFACATPVVASDIDGYREVVTPETAVSVPAGDVDALIGAVEGLLADEPRRAAMGEAARRRAEENFAWPDVARRLEEIYERLVARPAARTGESVAA